MRLPGRAASLVDLAFFHGMRWFYRDREVTRPLQLRKERFEATSFFANPRLMSCRSRQVPVVVPPNILDTPARKGWRQFAFASPVRSRHPSNNLVINRYYPADAPPERPIILLVPAYRTSWIGFHLAARAIAAQGFPVILTQPPYHQDRTPAGSNPGEHLISADLIQTLRGLRQGIKDLTALFNFLESRGRRAGLLGVSLGSLLSAYTICSDPRPAFAALVTPVVNPVRTVWRSALLAPVKANIRRLGYDYWDMARLGKVLRLDRYQPRIDPRTIFIAEAIHDQVVPSVDVEKLVRVWGPVERRRYHHGHISVCFEPDLFRDARDFLARFR